MNWPHDNDSELDAFYTRPEHTAAWEVTNLCYIALPWKAYLAGTDIELKRGIRCHKKVAESLGRIFASLWETFGKSQAEIEKVNLHQLGGAYEFRVRRQSKRISNHARGIAIDLDPQHNPMRRGGPVNMDPRIVAAFEAEGWRWGKAFNDPMHFEAVWNGKPAKPQTAPPAPVSVPAVSSTIGPWIAAAEPLIKRWESFRAKRYWDVKQWAIGYGQKANAFGEDEVISEALASKMLADYLAELWLKIAPLVTVQVTANEGGALLSFAYNLGSDALAKSTLLKKLNAGDHAGASNEFGKWVKAGGKKLPGLVKRREAERQLFLS